MNDPITVILKTGSACNMACRYCDADIYSKKMMSFKVLANTTKKILNTGRPVQFIWHGGEPLLAGKEFFKKAVWLQEEFSNKKQFITNSIQTNGILLNESWLDFFDEYQFDVGISLDGPEELHNKNRIMFNGKYTFEKVMNSISLIKKRYNSVSVLAVVTEDTLKIGAKRFFNFFIENGIKSFGLINQKPAVILGKDDYIKMNRHSQFLNDLFDLWLDSNDSDIHILEFESILNSMSGDRQNVSCVIAGDCIGKFFAVNYNGDIYHCDEFMNDSKYNLGNILNIDFEDVLQSEQIAILKEQNKKEVDELPCKWFSICNGGCPKDRYVNKMFSKDKLICCGFSDLIEHIAKRILIDPQMVRSKLLASD